MIHDFLEYQWNKLYKFIIWIFKMVHFSIKFFIIITDKIYYYPRAFLFFNTTEIWIILDNIGYIRDIKMITISNMPLTIWVKFYKIVIMHFLTLSQKKNEFNHYIKRIILRKWILIISKLVHIDLFIFKYFVPILSFSY